VAGKAQFFAKVWEQQKLHQIKADFAKEGCIRNLILVRFLEKT
jgi:hypothetical protein